MATATEKGIRVDRSDKDSGLDYGNRKAQEQKNNKAESRGSETKLVAQEKRKVKNQAEIDRVKRENERIGARNEQIDRRREKIRGAVGGALELVARKLGDKSLSEKERARLMWIRRSVTDAESRLQNGTYKVEVKDGNKVIDSRLESVPVEGLMQTVNDEVQWAKKSLHQIDQIQNLKRKAEANTLDEDNKKREWRGILDKIPEGNLKKRIMRRAEEWKKIDEERGEHYDQARMDYQLGEACYQVIKEYTEDQINRLKKRGGERSREIERYQEILNTLDEGSDNYFAYHYGKLSKDVAKADSQKQNSFTVREADFISKDAGYRQMLLEDYKGELPKGFDNMDKQRQDYELAMLALDNRRILNMPRRKELWDVPEPDYEKATGITGSDRDIPPNNPEKHKLHNDNDPYDIENKAIKSPDDIKGIKEPPPPTPEAPKQLFLIDLSEIAKRMAWTKAEERLQKEFKDAGVLKRVWKGLSENNKRIKYFEQAKKEIETDNNLMKAISERVSGQPLPGGQPPRISAEYFELLDKVVAEYKHDVVDTQREVGDSMKGDAEVQARFSELLYRFRTDKWDVAAYKGLDKRAAFELFVKENIAGHINKNHAAQWTKDASRAKEAKGLLYASNFYEICESIDKNYKVQIDAAVRGVMEKNPEANIEAIREAISKQVEGVQGLNLQLGLRDRDLVNNRPKGILATYEKLANWGENHKVLGKIVLNPFVIGAATAVASRGVQRALKWGAVGTAAALGATGFWVPLGAGALVGGAYRAFKRSKDVKYDQAQELRQETLGGKGSEVLGEKGSSKDLRYEGAVMTFKEAMEEVKKLRDILTKHTLSPDETEKQKQRIAKIYARLQLERDLLKSKDERFTKVDLFSTDEETGKRFGTTAGEKSDLRVELKKLENIQEVSQQLLGRDIFGFSEKALQGRIDAEKGAILDIINSVNKKQESFRHKEMWKAGVMGAAMGLAGGLAVEGIKEGSHLFSEVYQNYHHDKLAGIAAAFRNTDLYHRWIGSSSHIEHFAPTSHGRTATEYLAALKGHVSGGNVETVHTQNWYDNDTAGETQHIHNLNELKFHITKDHAGNFHFKVPVKEHESWFNHPYYKGAEIDKAFSEGRIKMIFVPEGGHGPHEGIVLDVGPNREIIIPHDSNLKDLFDPTTGRPKGGGFFGLAEQTGARADGSKNYIWINSEHGNGSRDFGGITENVSDKVVADRGAAPFDSWTIPTVPPTRKVWLRPKEREAKEAAKKKKEEEKAKKNAEKEAKKHKADGHKAGHGSGGGGHETGGGGGGGEKGEKHTPEQPKGPEVKAPEFKGDMVKRYTNPKYVAELLKVYDDHNGELPKINRKAINAGIEGNKGKGLLRTVKKDIAAAVWALEQALLEAKAITQDQADEFYEEVAEPEPDKKEQDKNKSEENKPPTKQQKETPTENEKPLENGNFEKVSKSLIEKTSHQVHFNMDGELMGDGDKVKVLKALDGALSNMDPKTKNGVLRKFNSKHKGGDLERGLIVAFPADASKIQFDRENRLIIPPTASAEEVKNFLLEDNKKALERKQTRRQSPKKTA